MQFNGKYINMWSVGFFIIVILFIVQTTLIDIIAIFGIKPNLLMCALVCAAMFWGEIEGAVFGVFTGLIIDFATGHGFAYTIVLMLAGAAVGILVRVYIRLSMLSTIVVAGTVSLVVNAGIFFLTYGLSGESGFFYMLWRVMLPEALYTVLFSPLLYLLFYKLNPIVKWEE